MLRKSLFTSWATREDQEYWSGKPISSSGDLPDPGIKPGSPALQANSLPAEWSGKPYLPNRLAWQGWRSQESRGQGSAAHSRPVSCSGRPVLPDYCSLVLSHFSRVWLCDLLDCNPLGSSAWRIPWGRAGFLHLFSNFEKFVWNFGFLPI